MNHSLRSEQPWRTEKRKLAFNYEGRSIDNNCLSSLCEGSGVSNLDVFNECEWTYDGKNERWFHHAAECGDGWNLRTSIKRFVRVIRPLACSQIWQWCQYVILSILDRQWSAPKGNMQLINSNLSIGTKQWFGWSGYWKRLITMRDWNHAQIRWAWSCCTVSDTPDPNWYWKLWNVRFSEAIYRSFPCPWRSYYQELGCRSYRYLYGII